ncbi:MAG: phage virion morphogenesis protein [Deltaproteobacteria bacterium]|nr:phage virion morphogenesis protein [Deltaproteobacteria bacterium]
MTVRGDDGKLRKLVELLARASSGQLARSMRSALAQQTREEIDRSFRERRSPDGTAWPPLKSNVGAPLIRSGALRSGFDVSVTAKGVSVTNAVSYASVHQRGARLRGRRRATKKARGRSSFGARRAVIPARPMVPAARWGPAPTSRLQALASRIVRQFFRKT